MTTATETALLTHARAEIVAGMVRAEAVGKELSEWQTEMAVNAARNAIHDGRSAWYGYEVAGKGWLMPLDQVAVVEDT